MDVLRTIRTSPPTSRRDLHDGGPQTRLLLRICRDVLRQTRIDEYADLKPAVLGRLRQLRVRHSARELNDALSVLSASGALRRLTPPPVRVTARVPDARPLSRMEAADLYARLLRRCGGAIKTLPSTSSRIRIDDSRGVDVVDLESLLTGSR